MKPNDFHINAMVHGNYHGTSKIARHYNVIVFIFHILKGTLKNKKGTTMVTFLFFSRASIVV